MDGPTVNKKFFQDISAKFKNENYHLLADIASCSLHNVHRSLQNDAEKSEGVLKILKNGFMIPHEIPATLGNRQRIFDLSSQFLPNAI